MDDGLKSRQNTSGLLLVRNNGFPGKPPKTSNRPAIRHSWHLAQTTPSLLTKMFKDMNVMKPRAVGSARKPLNSFAGPPRDLNKKSIRSFQYFEGLSWKFAGKQNK